MVTNRSLHNRAEQESLLLAFEASTQQAKMVAATKNLSTQRTFDSTDDLLENEEALEIETNNEAAEPTTHENVTKVTSVWDCRAVHWPPHSLTDVVKSGYGYVKSPYLIAEVFFLGLFILLCHNLPRKCSKESHIEVSKAISSCPINLAFNNVQGT